MVGGSANLAPPKAELLDSPMNSVGSPAAEAPTPSPFAEVGGGLAGWGRLGLRMGGSRRFFRYTLFLKGGVQVGTLPGRKDV